MKIFNNKIFIVLSIMIFFILGAIISRISNLSKPRSTSGYTITTLKPEDVIRNDRAFIGDTSAIWTLIEFGDYQCPGCIRSHNTIKSLISKNINLRYQFRHYPLVSIHDFAKTASLISIESERLKIYNSVHEDIFNLKGSLSERSLLQLCKKHNIKSINKKHSEKSLTIDLECVEKLKIDSTPSFFLCTPNSYVLKINSIKSIDYIIKNRDFQK